MKKLAISEYFSFYSDIAIIIYGSQGRITTITTVDGSYAT